jgi:hypothetical protein
MAARCDLAAKKIEELTRDDQRTALTQGPLWIFRRR